MTLTRIYDGIAPRDTTFQILNRYQEKTQNLDGSWTDNPYHGPIYAGQWFEIEGGEYDYFLNCLPPLVFNGSAFAMSEFTTGHLTNSFYEINNRFFCVTVEMPERSGPARQILNQTVRMLREAIQ